MARYQVRINRDASADFPFIVAGEGRPRYFKTYSEALSWVLCMEALERDIARVVRLRIMRGRAA